MDNRDTIAGRIEAQASKGGSFWTFDLVEEALVEAMTLWRRSPDRERGWHAIRAYWPEINRHTWFGDYADHDATPRPLPLTRDQVDERDRVSEWLAHVDQRDRKLVVLALACLAGGEKRVPWRRLLKPMCLQLGADGLRKRYSKAITSICHALNAAENRPETCQ